MANSLSNGILSRRFGWYTFDINSILPDRWQEELLDLAKSKATARTLTPTSVTSREDSEVTAVPILTVGGCILAETAPWLLDLYESSFKVLGERVAQETLYTATDPRIKVNLNIQAGNQMRYEAHVDSNPLEGILYVTDHPPGSGGELVVAQNHNAVGIREIDKDAAILHPKAGCLVFFDARLHAHYVRPLCTPDAIRVAAVMNFYTASCSERSRPTDLNIHLFGKD